MIFVFAGCELDTDAFALARDADHTFSLASAHEQAAVLHQLRDEPTVVLDHAATALEMARAQGFGPQVAIAQILWGWSHAALGGTAEGLDELRAGIEAYRATGARMDLPYYLGLLADALLRAGRIGEALEPSTRPWQRAAIATTAMPRSCTGCARC